MANSLYDKGREAFANGDIAWKAGGDTIKATLIYTTNYTVNLATHQYMNTNTVPANAKVATATLVNPVNAAGVCDGDDMAFSAVTGSLVSAVILWKDGGDGGTSVAGTNDLLIAYIDSATNLPVTPNGGDIVIAWASGASRIFKL